METYNLFTPEGRLRVTQIASVIVTVSFAIVFIAGSFFDAQRLETRRCPVHKPEKLPIKHEAELPTKEFYFYVYTDPYRKDVEPNSEVEEIAVLFLGEQQGVKDFRSLISIVSERTQDTSYHFHWYCVDFNRFKTLYSIGAVLRQYGFVVEALKVMKDTHPKAKIVMIANEFNGITSILVPLVKRDDERESILLPKIDLLVLGLTTIDREHVEVDVEKFETFAIYDWEGEEHRIPTGVVSIDSGEQMTQYPLKNVIHVPAWTIDNVPDNGISGSEALSCTPYLLHISDLLFAYARNNSQQTGKTFVKSFYQDFEKNKSAHLPSNWKKDTIGGALTISTGGSYIFSTESSEWVMVDLRQSESIWMDITGTCLKSATVIRQKKFISRKEDLINGIHLEFGIFKAKRFEDIRIFVESNGKCDLTINTSPSWQLYFDKFGSVLDGNYYFVGALITSTLLFILESDTRSFRVNQLFTCYIVFIVGIIGTVAFIDDILFFHERLSLFLGFGSALAIHSLCDLCDKYWIRKTKRSLDSYFVEWKAVLKSNHHIVILFIIATHFASSIVCMVLLFLLVITSTRHFLPILMLIPTLPLWTRAFSLDRIWMEHSYRKPEDKISTSYLKHQLLFFIGIYEIGIYCYRYFTAPKNPNSKRPERKFNQLSRYQLRWIYIPTFLLQLVFAHAPLELHFVATIFLLYFNMFTVQHIPQEYSKPVLNESKLNEQYDAQDKQKKENKKQR